MKTHWLLGIAGISIIIAGLSGFLVGTPAALIGGGVFTFAILFALTYWYFDVRPHGASSGEPSREEPAPSPNEASSYSPQLERVRSDDEFLNEDEIIREFMEEFGISKDKAMNLYEAGYSSWGDFSEAIPEDLVMVQGINPTISRRIISVVRSRM